MDIIDILLARALNPNVQIDVAAATARKAVADATQAVSAAEQALEDAQAAVDAAEGITDIVVIQPEQPELDGVTKLWVDSDSDQIVQVPVMEDVENEIRKLNLSIDTQNTSNSIIKNLKLKYGNTEQSTAVVIKYYSTKGQNTDGTMTQKAITDLVASSGGSGGGNTDMGVQNAGKMMVVGSDGLITVSNITEDALVEALIKGGDYIAKEAVGLQVDYENRSYVRIQESTNYSQGADFNNYSMYGGRKRCNVADNGRIVAWEGDSNYREDGSNGQVMVYQPAFYYSRSPLKVETVSQGEVIRKESIMISAIAQPGFKLHPLFIRPDGTELAYVLLSAYEGCACTADQYDLYDSSNTNFTTAKLSSIAGAKPISGVNKQFTVATAEQMAQNRGEGWHVMTMAAESAQQMLQLVEYGSMNSQASLEKGICYIPNNTARNCSSLTGSTSSLGSVTGVAAETINETNGSYTTYNTDGRRAISYRGFENPWGNIWRMIANVNVEGDGSQDGGIMYICKNYNYSTNITSDYESIGFRLPSSSDWISGFGVPLAKYDWIFMPIECSNANSAVPIGDSFWSTANLRRTNMVCAGGHWHFELNDGMFYYCCDQPTGTAARSYSARLMYIPTINEIYYSNIQSREARG